MTTRKIKTLEERLAHYQLEKPSDHPTAMYIIGVLLTKLELNDGILATVFSRSTLERFLKRILIGYFPASTPKNKASFVRAYKAFYDDRQSAASTHVRSIFTDGSDAFADQCTTIYEVASDLIHSVANIYFRLNTVDQLMDLVNRAPQLDENQRKCLHAIGSLNEMKASSTRS